jgi:hypothetical protein
LLIDQIFHGNRGATLAGQFSRLANRFVRGKPSLPHKKEKMIFEKGN